MTRRGTALVVGATSDIGQAITEQCRDAGYGCEGWGRSVGVDVTDAASVSIAAGRLPADLSLVVYAAGLFEWADVVDGPAESRRVVDTNLTGAVTVTEAVLPLLAGKPGATLVYIGSAAGTQAFPHNAAYVASKHGLVGYAHAVSLECRERHLKVKVSVINPGLVLAGAGLLSPQAQAHPEALLLPEDIARCVRFVADFPGRGCPVHIDVQPTLPAD